ncbi:MAG: succinate dehydrogenase, cytochrome b556 subunit [Gammaproteobacteria bacterium]
MEPSQRPLSPHLQVYRLPLTVVLSITHRITGAALSIGVLLLIATVTAAAAGPEAYAGMHAFLASWFGQLLLFLWTLALYFHFCNGIRHLFWDAGYGFELPVVDKTSYGVIAGSAGLTLVTWIVAVAVGGLT